MNQLAWLLLAFAVGLALYAYAGYPALLKLLAAVRKPQWPRVAASAWPPISITVPVHNEAAQVRELLDSLLGLEYPAEKRQILIVSDASTDGTDEIVAEYADRGVELLRVPQRGGKTAAENAALPYLSGEIVVNTDASIRFHPRALKHLVSPFADPSVGVVSGRDVSVSTHRDDPNLGESGYVGYEMQVRELETRLGGIVGASGCFYAIRADLHKVALPAALARDFAAPLIAREHGCRAVSAGDAVCYVPRTASLRREYRRKVRTIAGGMDTFFHFAHLLNPLRNRLFAWMLFSHKLCRWLIPPALLLALVALGFLALTEVWARWVLVVGLVGGTLALLGWVWPQSRRIPKILAIATYAVAGNLAVLHAWVRALQGRTDAVWEPTRREVAGAGSS